jgi:release factor glutamine methyltransferase
MKRIIKEISKGFDIKRDEAELIIASLLERPRFQLYMEKALDADSEFLLKIRLHQFKHGVPIEYITKKVQFMDYTFDLVPGVFIPRTETEYFVELIARHCRPPASILEIGTGCGAIAITLARVFPGARIVASDISSLAIHNARINIEKYGMGGQINLIQGDLYCGFKGRFDLIVSNPPYIPSHRLRTLPRSVRDFEPLRAIDGGGQGISIIERLIDEGRHRHLNPRGQMAVEIDEDGLDQLNRLLRHKNFRKFKFTKDLFGRYRYLFIGTDSDEEAQDSSQ